MWFLPRLFVYFGCTTAMFNNHQTARFKICSTENPFKMAIFTCKIATLNINGINELNKQMKLVNFLKKNAIDIVMLQEHNIKFLAKLEYILKARQLILMT